MIIADIRGQNFLKTFFIVSSTSYQHIMLTSLKVTDSTVRVIYKHISYIHTDVHIIVDPEKVQLLLL